MLLNGHWSRVFISMVDEYLSFMTGMKTVATLCLLESSVPSVILASLSTSSLVLVISLI
jgi:hypothetical protein